MKSCNKIALVPGSFDPVTKGHLDVINRASKMFGKVHAVCFVNPEKEYTFTDKQREDMLGIAVKDLDNVTVTSDKGLLADYAERNGITVVVKGIRNAEDLAYETEMAEINRSLKNDLETVFLPARPEYKDISSTGVKKLLSEGKDASELLPEGVKEYIAKTGIF